MWFATTRKRSGIEEAREVSRPVGAMREWWESTQGAALGFVVTPLWGEDKRPVADAPVTFRLVQFLVCRPSRTILDPYQGKTSPGIGDFPEQYFALYGFEIDHNFASHQQQ